LEQTQKRDKFSSVVPVATAFEPSILDFFSQAHKENGEPDVRTLLLPITPPPTPRSDRTFSKFSAPNSLHHFPPCPPIFLILSLGFPWQPPQTSLRDPDSTDIFAPSGIPSFFLKFFFMIMRLSRPSPRFSPIGLPDPLSCE